MSAITITVHVKAPVHLHLHEHWEQPDETWLKRLGDVEQLVSSQGVNMSALTVAVDRLKADVAGYKTLADSLKALIAGMVQQMRDNALDPKVINDLADAFEATSADLAQAVTVNTPAASGNTGDQV